MKRVIVWAGIVFFSVSLGTVSVHAKDNGEQLWQTALKYGQSVLHEYRLRVRLDRVKIKMARIFPHAEPVKANCELHVPVIGETHLGKHSEAEEEALISQAKALVEATPPVAIERSWITQGRIQSCKPDNPGTYCFKLVRQILTGCSASINRKNRFSLILGEGQLL